MKVDYQQFDDQQMLTDALSTQKFLTGKYNECVNECASVKLRDEMMNILAEEHQIGAEVFEEMSKRGWYPTEQAQQDKIKQAKQKFSNILTSL